MQTPPATDDPLKQARDAALLKLGRNVARFQQLESGLKRLYASLVDEGSDEAGLTAMREKRAAVLASRSMGIVVNAVFDALSEDEPDDHERELERGQLMYFRFRFRCTGPLVEQQRAALAALVDERNRLIHHVTDDYDLRSEAGIAALDVLLDAQSERIRNELRALQSLFDSQQEARRQAADFIASPAFRDQMELGFLQDSALIVGMATLALELAREDGWAVLSAAAQELRRRDPEAFSDLKARYGLDRLKRLLLASRLFELSCEPTPRGGIRVLFRADERRGPSV